MDAGISVVFGTVDGLDVAVRSSVSIFRMLFFFGLYFEISRIYIGTLKSYKCQSEVEIGIIAYAISKTINKAQ